MKTIHRSLKLFTLMVVVVLMGGACNPFRPVTPSVPSNVGKATSPEAGNAPATQGTPIPVPTLPAMTPLESTEPITEVQPAQCDSNDNFRPKLAPNWVFILRAPQNGETEFSGCLRFWHAPTIVLPRSPIQATNTNSQDQTSQSGAVTFNAKSRGLDTDALLRAQEQTMVENRALLIKSYKTFRKDCKNVLERPQFDDRYPVDPFTNSGGFQITSLDSLVSKVQDDSSGLSDFDRWILPILSPTPTPQIGLPGDFPKPTSDIDIPSGSSTPPPPSIEARVNCITSSTQFTQTATVVRGNPTYRNYALVPCKMYNTTGATARVLAAPASTGIDGSSNRVTFSGNTFIKCDLDIYYQIQRAITQIEDSQHIKSAFNDPQHPIAKTMVYTDVAILFTGAISSPISTNQYDSPLVYYQDSESKMPGFGLFAASDNLRATMAISNNKGIVPFTFAANEANCPINATHSITYGNYSTLDNPLYIPSPTPTPKSGAASAANKNTDESTLDVEMDNFVFVHSSTDVKTKRGRLYLPAGQRLWRRPTDFAREYDVNAIYMKSCPNKNEMILHLGPSQILIGASPLSPAPLKGMFDILIVDPGGGSGDGTI